MQNHMDDNMEYTETDPAEESGGKSIEELFEELEELTERMDSGNMPLEEAFSCYEQGIRLVKECRERLDSVEQRILQINGDGEISEFQ